MWSAEVIGALIAGLTALITVVGAQITRIATKLDADNKAQRVEIRQLNKQLILAEQYLFTMSRALGRNGIDIPSPPKGLFEDDRDPNQDFETAVIDIDDGPAQKI